MQTIRLEEPGRLVFASTETPGTPTAGEALVRVQRIGVCGTDIHAFNGKQPFFSYPRILGHELGVEVVAVGEGVSNVKPGDRCSVEPYLNCQKCIACRRGKPNCCTAIRVLGVHTDGGMREQFVLPGAQAASLRHLTLDQLALVETLGIGAHAVARAGGGKGREFALVIGAGPIGLAVTQFAIDAGARSSCSTSTTRGWNSAAARSARTHTINGANENVLDALKQLTDGDLPTAVFDATGSPRSMAGRVRVSGARRAA